MTTTRMMIHAATPAETDEAMTTTLLGGRGEGEGGGGGEGGEGGAGEERGREGGGGEEKVEGRGDDMGLQFSEEILSSGSTG